MERSVYRIVCAISALCILFSLSYYFSYIKAWENYEQRQIESQKEEQVYPAGNQEEAIVKPGATCIYQIYNTETGTMTEEEGYVTSEMVALKRADILLYLQDYMDHLPKEEEEKGLEAYTLTYFSTDKVVFQKSYNPNKASYMYYIVVENNIVVVYYTDWKTVYEYTGIDARGLSLEEQKKLSNGIKVRDNAELYSILEDYSS